MFGVQLANVLTRLEHLVETSVMHLSMLCPTYPKSGQVGDIVGSWYQDFVPRGGDFVLSLYFVILLPTMQL